MITRGKLELIEKWLEAHDLPTADHAGLRLAREDYYEKLDVLIGAEQNLEKWFELIRKDRGPARIERLPGESFGEAWARVMNEQTQEGQHGNIG